MISGGTEVNLLNFISDISSEISWLIVELVEFMIRDLLLNYLLLNIACMFLGLHLCFILLFDYN